MAPSFPFRAALTFAVMTICAPVWSQALVQAARSNDLGKVTALLREGSDPNEYADDNTTALSHAVQHGNIAMARALLDAGADPNVKAEAGDPWEYRETVYVFATTRGRKEMAELLLARGARAGDLALHYRAQFDAFFRASDFAAARRIAEENHVEVPPEFEWLYLYENGSQEVRAVIRLVSPGVADAKRSVLGDIVSWIGGKGATLTRGAPPDFPLSSSRLSDARQPDRYSAAGAFDGSLSTSWVEGRDDDGVGEMLAFEIPQAATTVGIVPGYGEQQYFATNNRVKAARLRVCVLRASSWQYGLVLETDLIAESTLQFEDSLRYQRSLGLPKALSSEGYDVNTDTLFAVIEIVAVYPGSRWRDTCIAEIRVR